jgi:hypothetical protein
MSIIYPKKRESHVHPTVRENLLTKKSILLHWAEAKRAYTLTGNSCREAIEQVACMHDYICMRASTIRFTQLAVRIKLLFF